MSEASIASDLLTVPDVMARLKLGRSTVYDLIRSRQLCSFTQGRSRRIPAQAVADYIARKVEEASA
jgi:excisionase family DNA binding protein